MNRFTALWGTVLTIAGVAMFFILFSLGHETFRPDLVPWKESALSVSVVGVVVIIAALFLPAMNSAKIGTKKISRYFWYAALSNTVVAIFFAAPILDPAFEFPILLTEWPGIYMVIAYIMFVLVGVVGMLGWSLGYNLLPSFSTKLGIDKRLSVMQFVFSEIGVYGLSISMFLGGYVGAKLVDEGAGPVVVGSTMEFSVIPSGISIFLLMVGTFLGIIAILSSKNFPAIEYKNPQINIST